MSIPGPNFAGPPGLAVVTYRKGVWTDRISFQKAGDAWEGQRITRDPQSFEEGQQPPVTMRFRQNGALEVASANGTKTVWETPNKLVLSAATVSALPLCPSPRS